MFFSRNFPFFIGSYNWIYHQTLSTGKLRILRKSTLISLYYLQVKNSQMKKKMFFLTNSPHETESEFLGLDSTGENRFILYVAPIDPSYSVVKTFMAEGLVRKNKNHW